MNTKSKSQELKSISKKIARKERKKVCIISLTDLNVDGRTQRQIKALRHAGYDVSIIFHQKELYNRRDFADDVNVIGISVRSRVLPKCFISYVIMYIEFCLKAIYFGLREKANLYQAANLDALLVAWVVVLLKKTPLIYDSQEIYTDMQGVKLKSAWKKVETILLKRVNIIIDVNRERAALKRQRFSLTEFPSIVMNCPEVCSSKELDRNALHKRLANLGLNQKKVVIYQGAIMRGRYLDNLVSAINYVRSDVILILMGPDVGYRDELKTLIGNLGVAKRVLFFDPISPTEIVSFLSGADIGVLFYEKTSLNNYYCAPTKLYEYLMAGLPILVNDLPHLKKVVIEERVGKLLNEMSPELIAKGINEMLEIRIEIERMSNRARKIACEKYNWTNQAKVYVQIIQGLISA